MKLFSPDQVNGQIVNMIATDPRHFRIGGSTVNKPSGGIEESFGKMLFGALNQVNSDQLESIKLTQKMITDPDSVNIHDVTIAVAKANLSLAMTKAIADRAIRAYREIINVR